MTQQTYRANLTAAEFPMISEFQGRTIIIPGPDQNYSRQANSPKNKDRDIGIPQVYYCHNIIGTDAGLSSVGYQTLATAPLDTDNGFQDVFNIRDINDNVGYLVNTTSGRNYILPSIGLGWLRTTDKAPVAGGIVSIAFVNGETYIFFGGTGCFKYNFATNTLDPVTLAGLSIPTILGIATANGYLLAWTSNKVFWSSTIDPTDFVPSLVTGAGSSGLQQAKGSIVACLPQNGGFIAYTKKNAVAMIYTNNVQTPFTAKENIGAGGLSSFNLVAYDGNSTDHYAYTTDGLQQISLSNSAIIHPQVSDFIAGSQFEDFDETTFTFTELLLSTPMQKKVTMVSNRYLVLSYGVTQLTHALVYDYALARWGKFKVNHVDCFEYTYPSPAVVETPRRSIAFMQADGTLQVVVMSYDTTGSSGVVLLGKYQYDRNRYVTMQEVHLESVRSGAMLAVTWLTSIDGKNTVTAPCTLVENLGTYRRYNSRTTGLNHSLVISGGFQAHSLELKFSDAGAVR